MTHEAVAERLGAAPQTVGKLCAKHGIRCQRRGPRSGDQHPDWTGGVIYDRNGYRLVYRLGHPMARKRGKQAPCYVPEHRLVMAEHLGRMLDPREVVHHKNGDKQDNRIENLELYTTNAQHLRDELTGRCPNWTEEGKRRMRDPSIDRRKKSSQKGPGTGGPQSK